jgi:plastocyanin
MIRRSDRAVLPPLLLAGLIMAAATAMACGGSGGTAPPAAPPSAIVITLGSATFNPAVDTVAVGGTVTWNWASNQHDLVSTGSPAFTGTTGGLQDMPYTYGPVTFASAGTYQYYCSSHGSASAGMRGAIVVK